MYQWLMLQPFTNKLKTNNETLKDFFHLQYVLGSINLGINMKITQHKGTP
mgnify:CR=1 FL=1